MADQQATSEAKGTPATEAGEQRVPEAATATPGTNQAAPSISQAPEVQEQPPAAPEQQTAAPATQQPDIREIEERIRRKYQSQKDREIAQVRVELEQLRRERKEAEQQALRQRIEEMDGEEYKAWHLAEQERLAAQEQARQQAALEAQAASNARFIQTTLNIVTDESARDTLHQRLLAGEFPTPEDFLKAAKDTELQAAQARWQAEAEREAERRARAAREAAEKNAAASLAETVVPESSTGQPVGTTRKFKDSTERIRWQLEQDLAALRRARGG